MAARRAVKILLVVLPILFGIAAGQADEQCLAESSANTDPSNAVADALSNSIAQAFTKAIACDQGAQQNANDVASLAIAVSVAISESRVAGEECVADANAQAEEVAKLVTDKIGDSLVGSAPTEDQKKLSGAWLDDQTSMLTDTIREGEKAYTGGAKDSRGCIDLRSLAGTTPTAAELGVALEDAIGQVLQAVTCGDNLEPSEEPCSYQDRMFKGQCVGGQAPAPSTPPPVPTVEPPAPVAPAAPTVEQPSQPPPGVLSETAGRNGGDVLTIPKVTGAPTPEGRRLLS